MLRVFAIAAALICGTAANASEWQSDYAAALTETRTDKRPLLMVIDEPGVAQRSISEALLNDTTNSALAEYELCHVDVSTPYGQKVAEAFKTKQFPYVAFIDKSGSVILHSQTGELSSSEWSELVNKYRTGEKQVQRMVAKPVVNTTPVSTTMPATQVYDNYQQYLPSSSARPYCAKCQRGY